MPDDKRILAALILLGLAAVVTPAIAVAQHIADLWRWHVDAEPIVIDTQRNGGVRA